MCETTGTPRPAVRQFNEQGRALAPAQWRRGLTRSCPRVRGVATAPDDRRHPRTFQLGPRRRGMRVCEGVTSVFGCMCVRIFMCAHAPVNKCNPAILTSICDSPIFHAQILYRKYPFASIGGYSYTHQPHQPTRNRHQPSDSSRMPWCRHSASYAASKDSLADGRRTRSRSDSFRAWLALYPGVE